MFPVIAWLRLARWREWAQSKLLFVAAAGLLLVPSGRSVAVFTASLASVALWAAFGYGINEVADRSCDTRAGKVNRVGDLTPAGWGFFLILTASASWALSLWWAADVAGSVFVLAGLAVAAVYSLPPLRLKERGLAGLISAALAQWSLPLLAVSGMEPRAWLGPDTWCLALLGLAIGMRWMAVHQTLDGPNDRRAGVRTYAALGGDTQTVIHGAFLCELALLGMALWLTWPRSAPACIALMAWLIHQPFVHARGESLAQRLRGYDRAPLAEYYFLLLPVALALDRARSSPLFVLPACLFVMLGHGYVWRMAADWSLPGRRRHRP